MRASAVTKNGQVTIPAAIRKRLGLREGDRVAFVEEGEKVQLRPVRNDVAAIFGLVKSKKSVSLAKMEAAIRKRFTR
jgi:AbrB family looped-hinge helix DNA binding protein